MRYIPLIFLLLIPIQANAENHTWRDHSKVIFQDHSLNYYWIGGSVGKDVMHLNDAGEHFNALTVSLGSFPKGKRGFGFISYLEYSDFQDESQTGNGWTIGFEPIWKYKIFYAGLGLSLSDDYTSVTGTRWNFSIPVGVRFDLKRNKFIDANARHRSHGSRLGIQEGRDNNGLNILGLQFGVNF